MFLIGFILGIVTGIILLSLCVANGRYKLKEENKNERNDVKE